MAGGAGQGRNPEALKGKVLTLLFTMPSTRTRLSFSAAMAQLGGSTVYIDQQNSQLKRGETLADTARMISSYCNFIAVRTEEHGALLEIAANSSIPVINALTMQEHPTQALTDMYTILKHKSPDGLRIALVGDIAQNTFNSLMLVAAKLGAEVRLIGPRGYKPNQECFSKAARYGMVRVYDSVKEGMEGADIVYTDTFVSMGDEREAERRRRLFAPYQVNKRVLAYAKPDALVMHPLPAHRGEEITSDVLDGPRSIVWDQARNKLVIAKAVLLFLAEKRQ
jgi:ornithine carbamoyltransferase